MANEINVRAQAREVTGKQTRLLRKQGLIPGNISGGGKPSVAIQLDQQTLREILKAHGAPILRITVEPGAGTDTALLARVERDAVSTDILHVDFRRIVLSDPIKARVTLHTEGEAPAVKLYGGVLLHLMESVEVEALPRNLPEAVTIDISGLTELNTNLTAKEIKTPPNVRVLVSPDEPVVMVKAPRIETPEETAVASGGEQPLTATEATEAANPPSETTAEE